MAPRSPTSATLYDLDEILARGAKQFERYFSQECGVDPDLLLTTEGPCPKCGGNTRFRVIDSAKGALFCSHCFNRGNGDVFAATQWLLNCSFSDAVKRVASYFGVEPSKHASASGKPNRDIDPAKDLIFQPWREETTELYSCRFIDAKPPVTMAAIKFLGGRFAQYKKRYNVIALPVWGENAVKNADNQAKPVGWILYNANGGTLPKWNPQEKKNEEVKVKLTNGSQPGIVGNLEAIRAAGEVWKLEGSTDLLAFHSLADLPPGVAALTNANGCGENPQRLDKAFMLEPFRGKVARVCHDCDQPGQRGAIGFTNDKTGRFHDGWAQAIATVAKECRNVVIPFEIEETHGKDFRDWAIDGGVWQGLVGLVNAAPMIGRGSGQGAEPLGNSEKLANYTLDVDDDGNEKTVPLAMAEVIRRIFERTENWPRRVGASLFVHDADGVHWLANTSALFGWLGHRCGVIEWGKVTGCVTKDEVFHELCRVATRYCSVETLPHFPPLSDHYYACKQYEPGDGEAITKLVKFFSPETQADEDLILALFCTPFWGGKPGSRPAFLITSDAGRGVGKSKITDMVSMLLGGACIDLNSNEDAGRMRSRLLSPEGLKSRLARLDNVKTLRFSWAELESVITSPQISGHKLHAGEASRPNNLMWLITLNGASLSTDMAQRVIIIKLTRPRRISAWETDVTEFITQNRDAIISDIKAIFDTEPEPVPDHSRWAAWEDQVVGRLPDPSAAKKAIKERSVISDVEAEEMELVEEGFAERLKNLEYSDSDGIFIPSGIAGDWYNAITGERKHVIGACRMISQWITEGGMKRLEKSTDNTYRGFYFFGSSYSKDSFFYRDLKDRLEEKNGGNSQRKFF